MVAEHSKAVKGEYLELLGHYVPAEQPKKFDINKDRVNYWLSKGAKPSDSMATLLKRNGFTNMDEYIEPKNRQRTKKKGGEAAPLSGAAAAEKEAPATPAA